MPRRPTVDRPIQPVTRQLLTRTEAAAAMGMSEDSYKRHVEPDLKVVILGSMVLVPPDELARWTREHARHVAA